MPYNGNGVFVRVRNWVNDAASNIPIRADRHDSEDDNFASGLSQCITRDGQTTITANLPMAGYRHTNVGNASARTEYSTFSQVQDGVTAWAVAGGTSDAITAAYTIPITTLVDGQLCYVRAGAANTTTTPTFSPNGLTARTIVRQGGAALAIGNISGAGHELELRYNLANTRWELLNPAIASVTNAELADMAEATIKGRAAGAGTGAPVDLTATQASDILAATGNGAAMVYRRDNILGTVSQSAGVPTGAILEQGSNANGSWIKYASGAMIAWHEGAAVAATTATGSLWLGDATWTLPVSFAVLDTVTAGGKGTTRIGAGVRSYTPGAPSPSSVLVRQFSVISDATVSAVPIVAYGKWF